MTNKLNSMRIVKQLSNRLVILCFLLTTFQYANAQQKVYYQKVQQFLNGDDDPFPDSERNRRCLNIYDQYCHWEGEDLYTSFNGEVSKAPAIYVYQRSNNGTRIYELRTDTWVSTISIFPDYSKVYKNTQYFYTGDVLLMVFNRIN